MIKIPVVRLMVFNRLHLKFINAYGAYIIDIANPHHGIMRIYSMMVQYQGPLIVSIEVED